MLECLSAPERAAGPSPPCPRACPRPCPCWCWCAPAQLPHLEFWLSLQSLGTAPRPRASAHATPKPPRLTILVEHRPRKRPLPRAPLGLYYTSTSYKKRCCVVAGLLYALLLTMKRSPAAADAWPCSRRRGWLRDGAHLAPGPWLRLAVRANKGMYLPAWPPARQAVPCNANPMPSRAMPSSPRHAWATHSLWCPAAGAPGQARFFQRRWQEGQEEGESCLQGTGPLQGRGSVLDLPRAYYDSLRRLGLGCPRLLSQETPPFV